MGSNKFHFFPFKRTLILMALTMAFTAVICDNPLDLDFMDLPTEDGFEIGKKNIAKQHSSKLRLKGHELYLPQHVIPTSYKIKLRPILETLNPEELYTCPGTVQIDFKCVKETDLFVLHAQVKDSMKIIKSSVKVETKNITGRESKFISVIGHGHDKPETDFYELALAEQLQPGFDYVVHIDFVSKISTKTLSGLYLSNYTDPTTQIKKHIAVTQFEDISARKMFPCLDEPALKATFEISISRLAKYNSMCNMPLKSTEPDPDNEGYFIDHYPPTPPMSTYLVALVVSEFSCTTAPPGLYNKPVEACGPKHMIDKFGGVHAAAVSAKILNYYEELFLQPYPMPKMQSVAIPDFEAGAMENYGLNTYRISALMYYPGVTTEAERYRIESTVAHELAHQNFGDLVTCKTWNHIFLNEGFATFVSYFGVQKVSPEFDSNVVWYTGYFQNALRADASTKTHPIVKTEDYFGDFDAISYSKGASIIKMMENILTKDTLIQGLRQYLEIYSFGNTVYHNLFETLDKQAHNSKTHPVLASVTDIMESWTIHPGFPLIRVNWIFKKFFYVSQEKFQGNAAHSKSVNETSPSLWYCPIFIATSADLKSSDTFRPKFWLTNKEITKLWTTKSEVDWVIVNVESKAFLRVLYDGRLTRAIQSQLDKNPYVFGEITRAQLIDDAFECAWAKYDRIDVALSRTTFLGSEKSPSVWATALNHLKTIHFMITEDTTLLSQYKSYVASRINSSLSLIGVEQLQTDKGKLVMHRESLLTYGAYLDVPVVMDYAKILLNKWQNTPSLNPIPIDIQGGMYCASMINGEKGTFEFLYDRYLNVRSNAQKRLLVLALGCSTDPMTLQRLLENSTNPASGFTKNDGLALIQKLATNFVSRLQTYWYIRNDFSRITQHFESVGVVSNVLSAISRYWNTEDQLRLVDEFVSKFSEELKPVMNSINTTISRIKENIEWTKSYKTPIKLWFSERQPV